MAWRYKMPYITDFRFVDLESNENITLLEMDNLPGRASFAVEFSIIFDALKDYTGYVSLRKLDETVILDTNPFEIHRNEIINEKEEERVKRENANLVVGATLGVAFEDLFFEKPGVYLAVLILNEQVLGQFAITVVKRKV